MRRTLLALLPVTALTLGPLSAPATADDDGAAPARRGGGFPVSGPVFATPGGDQITDLILRLVNGTEEPAVIRGATGLTDSDVTDRLVAAHRRGVDVRMVIPGNTTRGCSSSAAQALIDVIGTDTSARSWVSCTQGSARNTPGTPGHMHTKVWGFTKTSGTKNVTLVTSQNATDNGAAVAWNDGYLAAGWKALHNSWRQLFGTLKDDAGGGYWHREWARSRAYATPVSPDNDQILRRIRSIPARGATIRVAVSAISYGSGRSHRSNRLARALAAKVDNGASAAVVYTKPASQRAPRAVRIMRRNGIRVSTFENDGTYLHNKFMTATWPDGNGGRQHRVWTGSEEWKQSSFNQDEFVLMLSRKSTVRAYVAEWQRLRDRSRTS